MDKKYELLYIIPVEMVDDLPKIIAKVETLVKKEGGNIYYSEDLGKKKLAYPIKKAKQGFYNLLRFTLPGDKVKGIKRELELMPEVIRSLFILAMPEIKKRPPRPMEKPLSFKKELPKSEIELVEKREKAREEKKVSIEELDQKIDEILKDDIIK